MEEGQEITVKMRESEALAVIPLLPGNASVEGSPEAGLDEGEW